MTESTRRPRRARRRGRRGRGRPPARPGDHHRHVRRRAEHRGQVLEDLGWFVVDNLPPALLPTLAELGGRSQGDVARIAAVVDVRSRAFFADLTAALGAARRRRQRPADRLPRGVRRRAGPPVRGRPPPAPAAGRRPARRRHRPRARAAARPARRGRPRPRHHRPQRARARRQGARRVRAGRARPARDGHVVRLQVRPAGRRRPRGRLPVPAQPALGARAAAADRHATSRCATTCSRSPARTSSSTRYERAARRSSATATSARASATSPSPSAAPAASTAASPWPRSSRAGCAGHGVEASVVHRDLGRE